MALIIEQLGLAQRVAERHHLYHPQIRIGRAWDNHVIISDPFVDPHHAVLTRLEDGDWSFEDLGSTNGSWNTRHKPVGNHGPVRLPHDARLILGRTTLRFIDDEVPVAPAQPIRALEKHLPRLGHPLALTLLATLAFALGLWQDHNAALGKLEWAPIIARNIGALASMALGAGLFALLGRTFRQEGRYAAHLGILLVCGMLLLGIKELYLLADFNHGLSWRVRWVAGLIPPVVISLVLWLCLSLATNLHSLPRLVISLCLPWGGYLLSNMEQMTSTERFVNAPAITLPMRPDSQRWVPSGDWARFMDDAERLFDMPAEAVEPP
jgi:hypothetical protein